MERFELAHDPRAFSSESLPGLDPGWMPVRVKKTHQNNNPEPRSDSIGTEKALAHCTIEFSSFAR
jgi:hypothetical protein